MSEPDRIDFTVIVPLLDERKRALDCVAAWVGGQHFPRDRYEVLVVSGGSYPALEAPIAEALGSQGRLVHHECAVEPALYNRGAREARGRWLFVSEAHCRPAPDCLARMAAFLGSEGLAGARCRSVGEPGRRSASLEARLHDELFRVTLRPGHWLKVLVHGTAIARDVFQSVGGLEEDLGKFAEWALAAHLHDRGHAMGYCPTALVHHRYDGRLPHMQAFVRSFVFGEQRFRARNDPAYCDRYFGRVPGASELVAPPPERARSIARALAWSVATRGLRPDLLRVHLRVLGAWIDLLGVARRGAGWPRLRAGLRLRLSRVLLGLALPLRPLADRIYVDHWARIVHHTRREHWIGNTAKAPSAARRVELAERADTLLHGFHAPESAAERRFRWSGPWAWIALEAPGPGPLQLTLVCLPFRWRLTPASLALYCGRQRLRRLPGGAPYRFACDGDQLAREGGVTLVCRPVARLRTRRRERRALGLPVEALVVDPA